MKKIIFLYFLISLFIIGQIFADEVMVTIEIRGATINGGTVHGGIYSNTTYNTNNPPEYSFQGLPVNDTLNISLQIPQGEYVIQVYQDTNNNGKLDFGLFNIPKEPIGISNWNGRGIPGNFNRHKVTINNGSKITVQLIPR